MQDVTTDARLQTFARMWKEVLGVERVEDRDNFFALGGHSLTALKLSTRIREELDLDVRLTEVFENATFGALKDVVRTAPQATGLF